METGIYKRITNADYHASDAVSKSQLDKVARSPAHYLAYKQGLQRKQTDAFSFGTEAHRLILEPSDDRGYIEKPSIARRSKADKEAWAEFFSGNCATTEIIENPAAEWDNLFYLQTGKFLLSADQLDHIKNMRDAVMSHPLAGSLLSGGVAEDSAYWVDEDTGIACRCRPDYVRDGLIIDLKTTTDASPFEFGRSAARLRYHVQSAFYLDGYNAAGGDSEAFAFVAVEKDPPYAVAVYVAEDEHISKGRELYQNDLIALEKAQKEQKFDAYGDDAMPLMMPSWAID